MNPAHEGMNQAHYISFYSGHTSFSSAMNTAIFLILLAHRVPLWAMLLSFISMESLVFSTAYFRILAGRHFLTDVICGACAGALVAWTVVWYHRREGRARKDLLGF
jgi:membrane-associated phospholipid phosphatase